VRVNGQGYRTASWVGIALAAICLVIAIVLGKWSGAVWLTALLIYSLWQVTWESRVPDLFDLLLVSAAVLNALGWAFNFFRIGPYDDVAHGYTTFAITLSLGYLVAEKGWLYAATIFCFGMAIGGLWEIVEWLFGAIGNIHDTVVDLIMDAVGALAAGILAGWLVKREPTDRPHASAVPS